MYYPDEQEILRKVKEKIQVCKAGGGLVYNEKGEVLFILRNGKWDLPKGGKEKAKKCVILQFAKSRKKQV